MFDPDGDVALSERRWRLPVAAVTGRRILYLGVVGHLLAGLAHLGTNVEHLETPLRYLFEAAVVLGIPASLFALLRATERLDPRDAGYWRLVLWGAGGTLATLLIMGLYLLDLRFEGISVHHPTFLLLLTADIGALFGVIGGSQAVRARHSVRRAQRAQTRANLSEKHRKSLTFLNRMLRHHVLNGLSIVLGLADRLSATARDDQVEALDTIRARSEEMVGYVEDIQIAVTALSGDVEVTETDLSAVLRTACERTRRSHSDVDIDATIPPGLTVRGTSLLGRAFEHLIENAVVHNDAETPTVRVTATESAASVRVTVADDGPGMSAREKVAYFERGEHGEMSLGEGLGLYFAESVLSLSGGEIRIEDNEPRGTRVRIELPKRRRSGT